MDDVMFAHKPRLLDVAAQLVQCTRSLGLGYKLCVVIPVAGQRTHGTTLQALKATLGTEYVVDDCIVITVINHSSVSSAAEINQLLLSVIFCL